MGDLIRAIQDLGRQRAEEAARDATLGAWVLAAWAILAAARTLGRQAPAGLSDDVLGRARAVAGRLDEVFRRGAASGAAETEVRWGDEWEALADWLGGLQAGGRPAAEEGETLAGLLADPLGGVAITNVLGRELDALVEVFDRRLRPRLDEELGEPECWAALALVQTAYDAVRREAARAAGEEGP